MIKYFWIKNNETNKIEICRELSDSHGYVTYEIFGERWCFSPYEFKIYYTVICEVSGPKDSTKT